MSALVLERSLTYIGSIKNKQSVIDETDDVL